MIVKFDGQDIKEMRDLPKIVADTPVGKDVEVIVIRDGKELKKTVKLARLRGYREAGGAGEEGRAAAASDNDGTGKKTLGLELAEPQ